MAHCSAVESYKCEAPAGIATGGGVVSLRGVNRKQLHTCAYCGEPVCTPCSDEMQAPAFIKKKARVRVCMSHSDDEIAFWLGLV